MRQLFPDGGLCTVGNGIRTAVSADGAKSVSEVEVGVVSRSAWISNSPSRHFFRHERETYSAPSF